MNTLPAIPEARGALDVHVVTDTCIAIETWAKTTDDVTALRDAKNKLAAIDEYLSLTARDGRAAVAATMRRLEVRIGQLLGPASPNGKTSGLVATNPDSISPRERHDMRTLAANEEIVERVIAESTDEAPASRRKVVEAIKGTTRRRRPLADAARDAAAELYRAAERVQRIVEDDRFEANKREVAVALNGHLRNTIQLCQQLSSTIN